MVPEQLSPCLELLRKEYLLVQAWKKTASYIRYHNWFSDTLALDGAAVDLPRFINTIRERLQSAESWQTDSLRIVPAPKSQRWTVREEAWVPEEGAKSARLRPLAHVSLADQVVATALMLCIANRVETLQGDSRRPVHDQESRRQVVSYGNRLFCDEIGGKLHHRWGSTTLYRAYYQDYRTFLSRPEIAAGSSAVARGKRVYVVHADLRQFYDRVHPDLLSASINSIREEGDDPRFYSLAASVLDWEWDSRDDSSLGIYCQQAGLENFRRVALPQGLVASGFFANIVLLPFDRALSGAIGNEIAPGIRLADSCRYVDDLRILVAVDQLSDYSPRVIGSRVSRWLGQVLEEHAASSLSDWRLCGRRLPGFVRTICSIHRFRFGEKRGGGGPGAGNGRESGYSLSRTHSHEGSPVRLPCCRHRQPVQSLTVVGQTDQLPLALDFLMAP